MKKILAGVLFLVNAFRLFGQGQLYVDNTANNNPSPTATANGLFFLDTGLGPVPITLDFNLNFYGGSDSANLVLLKSFVGPTATGDNAGPGLFSDPTGLAVTVPGATTTAFFRIDIWLGGAFSTYQTADYYGASGVFANPVATPPNLAPTLAGMPAVCMCNIPEPSTFALLGLAGAALLILRRKR